MPAVPSQITPATVRPSSPSLAAPGQPAFQPRRLDATSDAPPGAEQLWVTPKAYAFQASSERLIDIARQVPAPTPGTRVSAGELFRLASTVEAAFARAGHPLVRVILPPQSIQDGDTVQFTLVDGYIEAVDVSALPAASRLRVERLLAPLVGQRGLRQADLERQLLLASELPGIVIRSTLAAGRQPDATLLVLDGETQPNTLDIHLDNRLGDSLRGWQVGPSFSLNGQLGLGEQIYGTLRAGTDVSRTFSDDASLRLLAAGISLPLGAQGLTLGLEAADSITNPTAAAGAPQTQGHYQKLTGRLSMPLRRSRQESLTGTASLDVIAQSIHAPQFGVALSEDRYRAMRVSLEHMVQHPTGRHWEWTLQGAMGLGGRHGADASNGGVPLSRMGASPSFAKVTWSGQWVQPLPLQGAEAVLMATAQTSFGRPLMQSEQLSLAGPTLVSGPASGGLGIDSGAGLRVELRRALPLDTVTQWLPALQDLPLPRLGPYLYGASARGQLERPTAAETQTLKASALGVGLRLELGERRSGTTHRLMLEWSQYTTESLTVLREGRGSMVYSLGF